MRELGQSAARNVGFVQKDKGTYEPSSLVRTKANVSNVLSTPVSGLSPSSMMDSSFRNAQAFNSRSSQTNAGIATGQEQLISSPGPRSSTSESASLKDIHEYFISAVLGSFVFFLCRQQGFVPLNSRTIILTRYPTTNKQNEFTSTISPIQLATLDISLTSLGTLVVKAYSNPAPGLRVLDCWPTRASTDQLTRGAALCLAPIGHSAKFFSIVSEDTSSGEAEVSHPQSNVTESRSHGFNISTMKSWQCKFLDWLSSRGLDVVAVESGGWILVQVLAQHLPYPNHDGQDAPGSEELVIVPWPACLSFQTSITTSQLSNTSTSNGIGPRDPLSFAEEWFVGKVERTLAHSKRQRERQAADALSREQADMEARALQSNIYSPTALRRGSNAGAMYPTPPDAPHHPIGATPNFEGNEMLPVNPNTLASRESMVASITNNGLMDIDPDMWAPTKKEHTGLGVAFNDNPVDTDNLFGEMGGDIFGTDITDADFSFFDEPDESNANQIHHRVSSPDASLLPSRLDPTTNNHLDFLADIPLPDLDMTAREDITAGADFSEDVKPSINNEIEPLEATDSNVPTSLNKDPGLDQSVFLPPREPFNKETVFNRLFKKSSEDITSGPQGRASLFNGIKFEPSLTSVSSKYGINGQFSFKVQKKKPSPIKPVEVSQTTLFAKRPFFRDGGLEAGQNLSNTVDIEPPISALVSEPMDYLVDSDEMSQNSEHDDNIHTTDKMASRGRWNASEDNDMNASLDAVAIDFDHAASTPRSANDSQLPLLDADPADWSLTSYFTSPEPDMQFDTLSDADRVATAQILTEQAISGTLRVPGTSTRDTMEIVSKASTTRELMHNLRIAANAFLQPQLACTMRSFLEIQGISVLNQGLRLPPRPIAPKGQNGSDIVKPNNPFQIPPPQLEVRRSDTKLSVLPSAVFFWENLGLGPSNCAKDVNAVCVYPKLEGMAANACIFLDQMRSMYETSRFGVHNKVNSKDVLEGLVPFNPDVVYHSFPPNVALLKDTTAHLYRILSSLVVEESNFVVYFVYPDDNAPLLVEICSAFQNLFNMYRKALSEKRIQVANELVLQLLPMSFIASPSSLAVSPPNNFFRLAMEVYDRCVDFSSPTSAPAIMLEQPLPKMIDFKLTATPSASVLQENTCLHIAYAQSRDERWVTAAWTDNRGTQQMTASYCMGRKNEPLSVSFLQVAREIWETTLDYISSNKIHWRLMIAKVGVMEPTELECWTSLASAETSTQLSLTLITVHTEPSIRLLPAPTVLVQNGSANSSAITPISTPHAFQSSIVSPETATPPNRDSVAVNEAPAEPDRNSRLVNKTDQSWGAVLGHRLNNSNSLVELNLALVSGYLIKRGGTSNDDPPVVMEVNIIHSEVVGNPRTHHELLLKEILGYYRGLGSLARVRGIVDAAKDIRPWHIAAAQKAVKALYMLM